MIPINGTASEVEGIDSATRLRNTVNDNNMVTPEIRMYKKYYKTCLCKNDKIALRCFKVVGTENAS